MTLISFRNLRSGLYGNERVEASRRKKSGSHLIWFFSRPASLLHRIWHEIAGCGYKTYCYLLGTKTAVELLSNWLLGKVKKVGIRCASENAPNNANACGGHLSCDRSDGTIMPMEILGGKGIDIDQLLKTPLPFIPFTSPSRSGQSEFAPYPASSSIFRICITNAVVSPDGLLQMTQVFVVLGLLGTLVRNLTKSSCWLWVIVLGLSLYSNSLASECACANLAFASASAFVDKSYWCASCITAPFSDATFVCNTKLPFINCSAWMSDLAASQNSIINPTTSSIADILFARAKRPTPISFQSQIISPATPISTSNNPGCLPINSMQTNSDEVARIILRHQKEDRLANTLLWSALVIFLISNFVVLSSLIKKS